MGSTALYRAARSGKNKSVRLLLKAGAKVNALNKKHLSPLIGAAFNGDEDIFRLLLEHGANAEVVDTSGKSALVYAAGRGFVDIVRAILDIGVDVNKTYGNNLTALMWAAGHSNDVPPTDAAKTVKLLLERGARIDLKDDRGKTAGAIAADMWHQLVLHILNQAK